MTNGRHPRGISVPRLCAHLLECPESGLVISTSSRLYGAGFGNNSDSTVSLVARAADVSYPLSPPVRHSDPPVHRLQRSKIRNFFVLDYFERVSQLMGDQCESLIVAQSVLVSRHEDS